MIPLHFIVEVIYTVLNKLLYSTKTSPMKSSIRMSNEFPFVLSSENVNSNSLDTVIFIEDDEPYKRLILYYFRFENRQSGLRGLYREQISTHLTNKAITHSAEEISKMAKKRDQWSCLLLKPLFPYMYSSY